MKKLAFVFLFLFVLMNSSLMSQDKQVLVKGSVTDQSGKILSVEIEFIDAQGNKTRTKSNEISGKYEQLLKANEKYTVVLLNDNVLRENQIIETKGKEKYSEQVIDLKGKSMAVGMNIKSGNLFNPSETNLTEDGNKFMEELKSIMRFNRAINIEIQINAKDTYSATNKDDDRLKKLVIGRVSAIEIMVMKWGGMRTKAKVKHNFEVDKTSKEASEDVTVTITSIDPLK